MASVGSDDGANNSRMDPEPENDGLNQLQLQDFVDALEPTQPAPCLQESVTVEGEDSSATSHGSHSASSCGSMKGKKSPREIIPSEDCRPNVNSICPISKGRVWIMYTFDFEEYSLWLFDAEGQMLVESIDIGENDIILNMDEESILLFKYSDSDALMISTDGRKCYVSLGSDAHISGITLGVRYGHHYITCKSNVHRGKVTLSGDQATYSQGKVLLKRPPDSSRLVHVSVDEQYFAFISDTEVRVYSKNDTGIPQLLSSYSTIYAALSACFCKIGERELLLVTLRGDNKVHVVDHKDGGRFVRYLDTGPLELNSPSDLATDYDKHLWIGCSEGRVVLVHLSADCLIEDGLHTE